MFTMPTININGTDGEQLFMRYYDLCNSADRLLEEMAQANPHGRDYQLAPDHASTAARDEHMLMMKKVEEVKKFFEEIAISLQQQIDNRKG